MTASTTSRGRLFASLTVILASALGLAGIEGLLRLQAAWIASSDRMDAGLVLYDSGLGWKQAPRWRGHHHHHDYDVDYTLDADGFRFDPQFRHTGPLTVVLGDSFTFGLGVADDQTFVALLNGVGPGSGRLANRGVIGYSTDQQLLLYRQLRTQLERHDVLLVTYLGNDLVDNQRAFPIQAAHAKPYFDLTGNGLTLRNTPVPLETRAPAAEGADNGSLFFGESLPPPSLLDLPGRMRLSRRLGLFQRQATVNEAALIRHLEPSVALYVRLLEALEADVAEAGGRLTVALLAGASFVLEPDGLSARYQAAVLDMLRQRLPAHAVRAVIDLATPMRASASRAAFYFPWEGHLTPAGHEAVARLLADGLRAEP